jgi:hypothetical protein
VRGEREEGGGGRSRGKIELLYLGEKIDSQSKIEHLNPPINKEIKILTTVTTLN